MGRGEKPLFGYYHEPGRDARGQILLCQPWGPEYEFAHRTMRFLARRLAARGWHVLRFDYRGTGDSWGETTEADLEGWVEDTALAAAELRAMTNLTELGFVGLRLGATIGAMASGRIAPLDRCLLWDPVLDGPEWIAHMEAPAGANPDPALSGGCTEFAGRVVTSSFMAQLNALESRGVEPSAESSLVLWTQDTRTAPVWASGRVDVETLVQPSPWLQRVSLEAGQIPVDAVTRVVEWIDR